MFIDPRTLFDETLDRLETLSVYLADETDERTHDLALLSPEARRCKEALLTIKVLIPKLRQARAAELFRDAANGPVCATCD